jgi:HlyD family secretion protein
MALGVCAGALLSLYAWSGPQVQAAGSGERPRSFTATGTVVPAELVDVGAQAFGRIKSIGTDPADAKKPITYNTHVKAGTVLARIDPAPHEEARAKASADLKRAEAGLRLARAKLVLAKAEFERTKLRVGKTADAPDVAVAKASVGVAEAAITVEDAVVAQAKLALGRAETGLHYCKVVSPIDGVVIDRRCDAGQSVFPGLNTDSLFIIAKDLKKMQVWARVKEADIGLVNKGQAATFQVAAYPDRKFKGTVANLRLNVSPKDDSVTYTAVIEADNADGKLLPYMTATVRFQAAEKKEK